MNNQIKIRENCIQILSYIDSSIVYTIWAEDFNQFRGAFKECEDYKTEAETVRRKYEGKRCQT